MSNLMDSILKQLDKLAAEDKSDTKTPFTTSAEPIIEKLWVEPNKEQKTLLEE